MNEFVKLNIRLQSETIVADFPCVCPNCGAAMAPLLKSATTIAWKDSHLLVTTVSVNCCSGWMCVLHQKNGTKATYLSHYPNVSMPIIPENLKFSQRFCELYMQASTAETAGHLELAGCGYRSALEVLIKDFAVFRLSKTREEVCQKKLHEAIANYLPNVKITVSADVIRVFDGDVTLYDQQYKGVNFYIFKKYLNLFIHLVDTELLLRKKADNSLFYNCQ